MDEDKVLEALEAVQEQVAKLGDSVPEDLVVSIQMLSHAIKGEE